MESPTEKANKRLTVWERIVSIEPAGRKPCACIAVSGESRLYITDGGIITHNTAGDPRNPLPRSYVGRNGRIKVLATVPDVERKAAALEAIPVSQEAPDFDTIYREASPEVRKRVADSMLRSQTAMFDVETEGQRNARLIDAHPAFTGIPAWYEYVKQAGSWFFPKFQGDKSSKFGATLAGIDRLFGKNIEKVTRIFDLFGGSGAYGLNIALQRAKNAKQLFILEFEGIRAERIKHFARRGDKFMADLKETGLLPLIEEIANEDQSKAAVMDAAVVGAFGSVANSEDTKARTATSGGGMKVRLRNAYDTDERFKRARKYFEERKSEFDNVNIVDAVVSAYIDRGSSDRGGRLEGDFTQKIASDAKGYHAIAREFRSKGGRIHVLNRDSMKWVERHSGKLGNSDLMIADPPYYHTSGYKNAGVFQTDGKWNALGYAAVKDMLRRMNDSKASMIYDDEAWFTRDDARGLNGKSPLPDVPAAIAIFNDIKSFLQDINIVPVGSKDKRLETIAMLDKTDSHERHGLRFGSPDWNYASQRYGRKDGGQGTDAGGKKVAGVGAKSGKGKPEVPGTVSKSDSNLSAGDSGGGSAGPAAVSVAPTNVLKPGTTVYPMPGGDAKAPSSLDEALTEKNKRDGDLGMHFSQAIPTEDITEIRKRVLEMATPGKAYEFGNAWLTPDAKWLNVLEHRHAIPEDYFEGKPWFPDTATAYEPMKAAGFARIVRGYSAAGSTMYVEYDRLTNAQKREIKDTAIELGWTIEEEWKSGGSQLRSQSVTPSQDARYLELAKDPKKNREELQWMVDAAAKNAPLSRSDGDESGNSLVTTIAKDNEVAALLESYQYDDPDLFRENTSALNRLKDYLARATPTQLTLYRGATQEFPTSGISSWTSDVKQSAFFARENGGEIFSRKGLRAAPIVGIAGAWTRLNGRSWYPGTQSEWIAVKSADPVTYDAQGSVIPLSQRFNPASNSILYSQSADPFTIIDALARKAFAETKSGGPRTVGDPKRAHSTDTEHWLALDEYRKSIFQRQKEGDWTEMADKMLATDYTGTVNGITAKLNARETLLPWETKAAEKVIAAEMAKDLYGSPEADQRRRTLYRFVFGLRQTRAETARSLAAFRDPHRTPEERMRAFAGELIFTPSAAAERKASGLTTEAEKDRRIATLEERLATLRDMAKTSQEQHDEIARLNRDLAQARTEATKEDIYKADADERYERVEKRLRELGVRIEDLMSEQVEVRLMGAKIVGDIAANFDATERKVIALSLGKRGGNIADIAERMEVSADEVKRILKEYQDAMKADLVKKFKLKAMGLDNLLVGGMDKAIKSAPSPDERSDFEAEELAMRAMKEMGIIPVDQHDTTIVRRTRTNQKREIPAKKDLIGMPAWSYTKGTGEKSLETLLERHGLVWQDAPTGEGKTTPGGKLDLGERAWEGAPTGEGKQKPDGSLDLTGPAQPYQFEIGRFDFDNAAQRLQAMRLMQSAAHGSTVFDYASEIVIANLLSAPTTAITNMTGYLYGIYRFTFRRAMEAALNFDKSANAATFGEFKPMFSALSGHMGTAFSNALLAWQTETPVTEALRKNSQQNLGMSFDEPIGKIPGKVGRFVRIPMRFLLATDEFAKTLLARTHAAAIAHRMGRAQGFEGKRLAAWINGQLGDTTSTIWDTALQEARYVTFQDKLRTFAEMDAEEIGALNKVTHSLEAGLAQLTKYKNDAGPDAGLVHNAAAFVLRASFPFLKTPYNLLYIGLKESPIGGIWEGVRQKGGFAGKERVKGALILDKEKTEQRIARLKREAGAAKNPADRRKAIEELQAARKTLADIEEQRRADPNRGYLFGKADAGKNVNARVAILTSAILTAALWAFGEGDDDDDEKWMLVTGTTPQKDPKAQGQRELRNRTIPEQSIRIKIGGQEYTFSYRRLDPFSTTLATIVDTLASIKGMSKGRSAWEAYARSGSSLMTQILDKASLRGFSQVADLILGGKAPTTSDVANTLAAWAVPNAFRNPMRNSDPMVRDTGYFGDDWKARALYAAIPTEKNAPPARRDLYGKPIKQKGNAISRTLIPGQPHEQDPFSREDITIRNWNLQNPAAPVAPETPDVKEIVKRYKATPEQVDRWMKARGEYIAREIRAKGLSGLKRPTAAQMDELEKIVGKSTTEARKQVFGK